MRVGPLGESLNRIRAKAAKYGGIDSRTRGESYGGVIFVTFNFFTAFANRSTAAGSSRKSDLRKM